jgi:hypothetical protein
LSDWGGVGVGEVVAAGSDEQVSGHQSGGEHGGADRERRAVAGKWRERVADACAWLSTQATP